MIKEISTLRRKLLLCIVGVAFAVMLLFCLTACGSSGLTEDDVKGMGYDVTVVFDYNGGTLNDQPTSQVYIKKDSKLPKLAEPNRTNYSFRYFATAKVGEDGKVKRDENNNIVIDKVWDFANDVPSGDITLYAVWWDNYKLKLHYGDNLEKTTESTVYRDKDGNPNALLSTNFNISGYTVVDYYYDNAFTDRIASVPMQVTSDMFEKSEDKFTLDVYCDALEGTYTIWREARDIKAFGNNTNIYLYGDIEMPANSQAITFPDKYVGKFIGKNHTISNLKVNVSSSSGSDSYYGVFKTLANVLDDDGKTIVDAAEISDVTFENVTLTVSLLSSIQQANIALFVGQISEGVKVKNVKVSGTINYDIVIGFTATNFIHLNEFYASSRSDKVTDSGVQGNINVIGSDVVYTDDNKYAVYVKGAMVNGAIVPDTIKGVAEKSETDESYSQIRFIRLFVKNNYGALVYTGSTVRTTSKISVVSDGNGGYKAEYSSAAVATEASNKFRVYLDVHTESGSTVLDGVYDMQAIDSNGNVVTGSVTSIAKNDNGTYSVTLDGVTYNITIEQKDGNFVALVVAA